MKYKNLLPMFIACTVLGSQCSDAGQTTTITQVKLSDDSSQNAAVARDLEAFDYRSMLAEKLGISDQQVLKDISWFREKNSNGNEEFRVLLGEHAEPYKKQILSFFEENLREKVREYSEKVPELEDAEIMAGYFINLIERSDLDTVWSHTSANFSTFASKNDLSRILDERRQFFRPQGQRKVQNRKIATTLGDLKGDFTTVTFVYENGDLEDITMEKNGNRYTILGYHFVLRQSPGQP